MQWIYETLGENQIIIKGFLFALILVFAGYHDIKTKTIPDIVHVLIALTALIGFNLWFSLAGALLVPLPFFAVAMVSNKTITGVRSKTGTGFTSGIGGGDIKMMAAFGFMLGVYHGSLAGIIGLVIAVTVSIFKGSKRNKPFALAPYLGIGAIVSYIILNFNGG
jgi:leader peptidase (prepilin peptidase) / N-methyltransferase